MRIVSYAGEAPSALGAPDVAKILELFRQQNEVLKVALTTVVLVPRGSHVEDVTPKVDSDAD